MFQVDFTSMENRHTQINKTILGDMNKTQWNWLQNDHSNIITDTPQCAKQILGCWKKILECTEKCPVVWNQTFQNVEMNIRKRLKSYSMCNEHSGLNVNDFSLTRMKGHWLTPWITQTKLDQMMAGATGPVYSGVSLKLEIV